MPFCPGQRAPVGGMGCGTGAEDGPGAARLKRCRPGRMRPLLRKGYGCTPKGVCREAGANQGGTAGFPPLRASQGRFLFVIWNTILNCVRRTFLCATNARASSILPRPFTIHPTSFTLATPTVPWPPMPWPGIKGSRATTCASSRVPTSTARRLRPGPRKPASRPRSLWTTLWRGRRGSRTCGS